MTRPRRPSERRARLAAAADRLTAAADTDQQVVAHLEQWRRGPSSTSAGPGPRNAVSDPTGQAATHLDEWGRLLDRWHDAAASAARAAAELDAIARLVATKPVNRPDGPVGLLACANIHGCPDDAWADHSRGRCAACAAYIRKYDRDRRDPRQGSGA